MAEYGWRFEVLTPAGLTRTIGFTETGNYSFDSSRDTPKTFGGFTLIPSEADKVNLEMDQVRAYLLIDDEEYSMGTFNFATNVAQKDAVLGPDRSARDLLAVTLADECQRLNRNDGSAQTLYQGFDPASEMRNLLDQTGIPYQVAGSPNLAGNSITWDGSTKMLAKLRQLGELSGHLPLFMDRFGVIRSPDPTEFLENPFTLESLKPEAGSITVTDNYLTAPNRVIVSDNSGANYQIIGQWDAPGSAPHSAVKRGYVTTEVVEVQGLESFDHANLVAATLGRKYSARRLSATILPTYKLDGPVAIEYDGVTWLLSGISINTGAGEMMSIDAEEYVEGGISG